MSKTGDNKGSVPSNGLPASFCANDCLLGVFDQGRENGRLLTVEVEGIGVVNADFESGIYQASVRSEADFFTVDPCRARVAHGRNAIEGPGRPIEELFWKAAYFGSSGKLLKGCNLYDVVELQRWPNFTRLPHARCCLPLCSLLARRPSSIAFAHRMLRVPPPDAMRFCSAARSAGYLKVISSQPDSGSEGRSSNSSEPSGSNVEASSFWGRLFSRFSGL